MPTGTAKPSIVYEAQPEDAPVIKVWKGLECADGIEADDRAGRRRWHVRKRKRYQREPVGRSGLGNGGKVPATRERWNRRLAPRWH